MPVLGNAGADCQSPSFPKERRQVIAQGDPHFARVVTRKAPVKAC